MCLPRTVLLLRFYTTVLDSYHTCAHAQEAAKGLQEQLGDPAAVVLVASPGPDDGKVAIVVALSGGAQAKGLKAGALAGQLAKLCGGGGGGRPNLATAGGKDPSGVPAALEVARRELLAAL